MSAPTSPTRLGNGGGQAESVLPLPLCPLAPGGLSDIYGNRVGTRDVPRPCLGVPADCVLSLWCCGLNPFRPALTDVLISQAGRPGPLGMNFWGPTGRSFSGTKRGKSWAVPAATLQLWGPHWGLWVALGSNLPQTAALGSECRVSLAPGVRIPSPSGDWMQASICIVCDRETGSVSGEHVLS